MLQTQQRFSEKYLTNNGQNNGTEASLSVEDSDERLNLFDAVDVEFVERDPAGNIYFAVNVDTKKLAAMVAQTDSEIINMSFLSGTMLAKYRIADEIPFEEATNYRKYYSFELGADVWLQLPDGVDLNATVMELPTSDGGVTFSINGQTLEFISEDQYKVARETYENNTETNLRKKPVLELIEP